MKVETQLPFGKLDPGLRGAPKLDLASVRDGAREIERLGFDGFVTGEIKTDPFIPLALAATTTERISLTTAVAIAFPRSPAIAVVGTYDDVAQKILERYGDFATRIEFSLPVRKAGDAERLRRVVGALQNPGRR